MAEKQRDDGIREEVLHADTINTDFHSGPHPQRPIPPDLNDAEKDALEQERRSLGHGAEPDVPRDPNASVLVDPEHPEKGVLYTGPSAEEELALRTGRSVDEAKEIMDAPGKRAEALQQEQAREAKPAPDKKPAD